jgi:hypothetical protein
MKHINNYEISKFAENFANRYSDDKNYMQTRRAFRAGMLKAIKILNGETKKE